MEEKVKRKKKKGKISLTEGRRKKGKVKKGERK